MWLRMRCGPAVEPSSFTPGCHSHINACFMSPDRFNKWRLSYNLASQTYLIVRVRGLRAPQHLFNSTDSVSVPCNPRRQTWTSQIGRCPTLPLPFPNLISFQGKNWFAFVWLTEAILILTEALRWFHGSCSSYPRAGKWHSMGVRRAPDYNSSGIWYSFILDHFSPTAACRNKNVISDFLFAEAMTTECGIYCL